jgi:AraC-like DNA-binding protein
MDIRPPQLMSFNLHDATRQLVMYLLENHPGLGRAGTAKQLGVSERTLYRYLIDFKLKVPKCVDMPPDAQEKVKFLVKNFPQMKRLEMASLLLRHYDVTESVVSCWLDRMDIVDNQLQVA